MAATTRSRVERATIWVVAWLLVALPLAWLAMLITGAWLNNRTPYWGWLVFTAVASLTGEAVRWLWRRFRKRGVHRG